MVDAGEVLRSARMAAGLSQTELARRARVPQSVVSEYEAGKRDPALSTLARLVAATGHDLTVSTTRTDPSVKGLPPSRLGRLVRQHRKALLRAVHEAGGSNLRVFGSVARGDAGTSSDVDLLVDLPEESGLFALLALEEQLQHILKIDVDLATESSLKPRVRAEALRDAVPV